MFGPEGKELALDDSVVKTLFGMVNQSYDQINQLATAEKETNRHKYLNLSKLLHLFLLKNAITGFVLQHAGKMESI